MRLRLLKKSRGDDDPRGIKCYSKHLGEKKRLSSTAVPVVCILVAGAAQ